MLLRQPVSTWVDEPDLEPLAPGQQLLQQIAAVPVDRDRRQLGQPVELVQPGRAPDGGDNHVVDGVALVGKDDGGAAGLAGPQDSYRRGQPVDEGSLSFSALQLQRVGIITVAQVDQFGDQALRARR